MASHSEEMKRGQAERLMPLLEELLRANGKTWGDLSKIGVGIGPGNFTGIRISVAAARGLALSLNIPAIGISTFDAIRGTNASDTVAIPGPRDTVYLQAGSNQPTILPAHEAPACAHAPLAPADMAANIARLAAHITDAPAPAPLYVRPADAAPARDSGPTILT